MGVKSLPLELILEIMLYLFIDVRGKPHKQFEALSKVCRMWTPYAQRLLFRNVRILHPGAALGFLAATRPQDADGSKERLGNSVRTLEMTIMTKQMIILLPFVIRHCPKLHELSLSFHTNMDVSTLLQPPPIPPELEAIYAAPHSETSMQVSHTLSYTGIPLPPILALRISCTVSPSPLPKNIIQVWPGVRHLEVSGPALQELCLNPRPSATDLETSFNVQLYEFQTGRSTNKSPPVTAQTFRASLKNSIGTLKILDLNGISDTLIAHLGELFKEHGPHLRSLRLPSISWDIKLPFLEHCTELEEIVVNGYPPKAVIVSCPVAKIQHASFTTLTGQANIPMKPALDWLRTFSSLSVLSWSMRRVPDITRRNRGMELLDALCVKRNVRMRTTSMFEIEEELIEPSSFPRDELMTALWR